MGGASQPSLSSSLELSSFFSIPKIRTGYRRYSNRSLCSQHHGSSSRDDLNMPERPTELEASDCWISKTKISGHGPPQEPLNRASGCVHPGQDQEE